MKVKIISIITICVALYACKKNSTNPDYAAKALCSGITTTYNANLANIINNSCTTLGCNNNAFSKAKVALEAYINAINQIKKNSKNFIAFYYGSGIEAMPKGTYKIGEFYHKHVRLLGKKWLPSITNTLNCKAFGSQIFVSQMLYCAT